MLVVLELLQQSFHFVTFYYYEAASSLRLPYFFFAAMCAYGN